MPYASVSRLAVKQANPLLQVIYDIRAHTLKIVYVLFPDPEASLLAGILLGVESGISPEVREAFNQTGTTHIIAISGFNITIIAAIFTSFFNRWLGARRGAIAAGIAIAVYTILVGADAAVVRAAFMGGLSLLALRLGRQTDGLASLAAAAIAMTALNPLVLWDVGFQLSFAATLGLILYAEPLHNWFLSVAKTFLTDVMATRLAKPVSEFALFTLAAQVMTLPLTAYYFKRISLSALLANPVILPAQPPVMILGGLATLAGILWPPLGKPLAWIAWPFTAFTIRVVEFFATWPMAGVSLAQASPLSVAVVYMLLICLTVMFKLPPERRPKFTSAVLERVNLPAGITLAALAVSTSLIWQMVAHRPDGDLHITVLDIGRGEGVLIESPTGRFALINGGSSPIALSEALGRRLPILHRRLDWVVIGGTRDDQVAGLAGISDHFFIQKTLLAGPPGRSAYRHLLKELSAAECPIIHAVEGHILDLGDGAKLEVLSLGEHGAAVEVRYLRSRFLFAPGADPAMVNELAMEPSIGPITALLLPDGGNESVNPDKWLTRFQPLVALISVEAGNSRGLPSPQVLQSLKDRNILRTDLNGWIELTTDGEQLWVEVERYP
jgi:competence protein ComEC